jgi:hypothetical protein
MGWCLSSCRADAGSSGAQAIVHLPLFCVVQPDGDPASSFLPRLYDFFAIVRAGECGANTSKRMGSRCEIAG